MNNFKAFQELTKIHDGSIVFRDWLDYCIDQFLINPDIHYFARDKYNKKEYMLFFDLFTSWVTGMQEKINEGYEWFDLVGLFYEETVKSSSKSSNTGQFFTPHNVCDLMTSLTININGDGKGEHMYDCAGGSGRLCLSFHARYPKALCFTHDLDEFACKMAVLNFLIHGVKGSVCRYNSLTGEFYEGWKVNEFPLTVMAVDSMVESMIFIGEDKVDLNKSIVRPNKKGQVVLEDYL